MTTKTLSSAAVWRGNVLFLHGKKVAEIVRDEKYASMWRVLIDGQLSDMVNLVRAKDAALAVACRTVRAGGNASLSAAGASPIAQNGLTEGRHPQESNASLGAPAS